MTIAKIVTERYGFITESELPDIIRENRLQKILVRTGGGRFICPAQDVKHFIAIIEKEGSDYIRDVSIFANA